MNIQKFTQKSLEAIQSAQDLATEYNNPSIEEEHLLKALLTADDSLIANLTEKMGIDKGELIRRVNEAVEGLPRVSGNIDLTVSRELNQVLTNAESEAKRMGDSYVSVEHLMLGLIKFPGRNIKTIFNEYKITRDGFLKALQTVAIL